MSGGDVYGTFRFKEYLLLQQNQFSRPSPAGGHDCNRLLDEVILQLHIYKIDHIRIKAFSTAGNRLKLHLVRGAEAALVEDAVRAVRDGHEDWKKAPNKLCQVMRV